MTNLPPVYDTAQPSRSKGRRCAHFSPPSRS